jgi:hypothetical protein
MAQFRVQDYAGPRFQGFGAVPVLSVGDEVANGGVGCRRVWVCWIFDIDIDNWTTSFWEFSSDEILGSGKCSI